MVLFDILIVLFLLPLISSTPQNFSGPAQTKTKRTVLDQTFSNENGKAVIFYMDSPQTSDVPELQVAASSPEIKNFYSASSKPLALVTVQQPIQVFEQDSPKQVAAQQVLYEFQQTPTNAESNVHVKQLFQPNNIEFTTKIPLYQNEQIEQLPTAQSLSSIHPSAPTLTANQHLSQFVSSQPQAPGLASGLSYHPATSETIISPVHHNIYTNHALNSASFSSYNPLLSPSQQYQNTQIVPKQTLGKYIYLNGKIVYHPNHAVQGHHFPPNNLYNKGFYQNQQKLPALNYGVRHNRPNQQNTFYGTPPGRSPNKFIQPSNFPPITNSRFQAPKQIHHIDKPSSPPQRQEATKEEDDKPVNEKSSESTEEEDDEEENEGYEEESDIEDDDDTYSYERFPFEDDDDLDEEDNHQFRPTNSNKNKGRSRYQDEEIEDEQDDNLRDVKTSAIKQNTKQNNLNHSRKYRMPPKFESSENYAYGEKYRSNMKYKTPNSSKKEKPQGQFKKIKYIRKPGSKPKIKMIEGRFSEHVPVTHKHKLYKERWYISKDDDGQNKNPRYIK